MGSCQNGRPAVWPITCLTSTFSLPAAANSGQYVATGAWKSMRPRSARISAHSAVIVLVIDQMFVMVSRSQGRSVSGSARPPHRSTTGSPST